MAKLQDIVTPQLQFTEGVAAPDTPASGVVRIYAKDDGLLYSKDDAGTETLLSSGATTGLLDETAHDLLDHTGLTGCGGDPSPLTTKGDLYVYGSANARLPVGTDGQVLTADSAQALGVKWTDAPEVANGVPAGGTAGQVLEKIDGTNYNAQWVAVDAVKIKSKNVNIPDFTGKDGYVLAYDEVAGEFYLKADDGGGGGSEFAFLTLTDKQFVVWKDYAISTITEPV